MSHYRTPLQLSFLVALLLTVMPACKGHPGPEEQEAHLLAIDVRQRAVGVAERMAERQPAGCARYDLDHRLEQGQPLVTNIRVVAVLSSPTGELRSLASTVQLRADAARNLALTESVSWREHGWTGARVRELRRVAGEWYLSEESLPFISPPAHEQRGMMDVREATDGWNRVLALVGDWQVINAGSPHDKTRVLRSGGRLRCELTPSDRRIWFDELLGESVVVDAVASTGPGGRTFFGLFEDSDTGNVLILTLDQFERVGTTASVSVPENVARNEVRRDFFTVRELVRRTIERRALPPALKPSIPELPATQPQHASLSRSVDDTTNTETGKTTGTATPAPVAVIPEEVAPD